MITLPSIDPLDCYARSFSSSMDELLFWTPDIGHPTRCGTLPAELKHWQQDALDSADPAVWSFVVLLIQGRLVIRDVTFQQNFCGKRQGSDLRSLPENEARRR